MADCALKTVIHLSSIIAQLLLRDNIPPTPHDLLSTRDVTRAESRGHSGLFVIGLITGDLFQTWSEAPSFLYQVTDHSLLELEIDVTGTL